MHKKLVALIEFKKGSFNNFYSYYTDIETLKEGDVVLVPTLSSYSVGVFKRYTSEKVHDDKAEKWIVANLQPTVEEFEDRLLLGDLD